MFVHGQHRLLLGRQAAKGKGKTYFYRFSFDSPTHNQFRLKRNRPNARGVMHADDLAYIFKHNFDEIPKQSSKEFEAVKRFVRFFLVFQNKIS